jgi:predicted nucleic acid-binding Zn ribbon protein
MGGRSCEVCTSFMQVPYRNQKYCSDPCRDLAAKELYWPKRKPTEGNCLECGNLFEGPKGKKFCTFSCGGIFHQKIRRARKHATQTEAVSSIAVYERDEWKCGLCKESVDRELKWPDVRSASLDHICPLELGGTHTYNNVQLAHLTCNVSKRHYV